MNLITDPWIPVIRKDGTDTIMPWQIAEAENPVIEINAPRPDFQGALYQFLIGLLQTCFAPKNEDEWLERWEDPPQPDKLEVAFDKVKDASVRKKIEEITRGYSDKKQFFIDRLAMGIGMLACAFYPKDVILRFSDFKSNEYANLIGGREFEPVEDNPMIGWRGASRYYDEKYRDAFALECEAVEIIRKSMGLTNLKVMVPFCRTVEEGRKVLAEMEKNGLKKGDEGLEVYVMCEIPANVILADEFLDVFDGFSIGSNDLTQLTLGLDRDSELVAHIYDERNDAVKKLVRQVVDVANRRGKHMGFCGQAPSDFPEFAEFLVECGIESMSLNPDTVVRTTLKIAEKEKHLGK